MELLWGLNETIHIKNVHSSILTYHVLFPGPDLPGSETAIEGSQAFYSSLSIFIYKLLLITFTSQGFMEMRWFKVCETSLLNENDVVGLKQETLLFFIIPSPLTSTYAFIFVVLDEISGSF